MKFNLTAILAVFFSLLTISFSYAGEGAVSGKVILIGRINNSSLITFELRYPGKTTSITTYSVTTDAEGNYILPNIPEGTYDLTAKAQSFLRAKRTDVAVSSGGIVTGIDFTLDGGDCDGNDVVNAFDHSIMNKAFGTHPGDLKWDARADIDGNGVVNAFDHSLKNANFGRDSIEPKLSITSHLDNEFIIGDSPFITVSGAIDDKTAVVTVNGAAAAISGGIFKAEGISLSIGPNTITVVAADKWGNSSWESIIVNFKTALKAIVGFEEVALSWDASDNPGVVGYNVYRRIRYFDSEPSVNIAIDGNFSDWNNVTKADSHPYPPEDLVHMQDVWVANDADNLYVRIKYSSAIEDALEPSIFLDVDRDFSTGSGSKNWRGLKIGAELWYDIRSFDESGNPFIRRRQWDNAWAGPYPYNEFLPGNYADPVYAWINNTDLTDDRWAVGNDGFYNDRGTEIPLKDNGWEIKIPFKEIEDLTGVNIDERKFGIDMFFSAYWDHFPTVGYAPKSPVKFEYGYKKINDEVITETSFTDHPIGTLSYDYYVFEVYPAGREEPVTTPIPVTVKRAHPANLNVSIVDSASLKVEFDYPEDPAVNRVRIIRRTDRFPVSASDDGDIVAEAGGLPNEHLQVVDSGLTTGQSYFYAGFGMTADDKSSQEFWDVKDRSIPAIVRGPIPGVNITDDYMIYFASWDQKRVDFAKKYKLVILHPGGGAPLVTHDQVAEIKAGLDGILETEDDVKVIGYVSIGEDFGINPGIIQNNTILGVHPNLNDYPTGPWTLKGYNYPRKIAGTTTGPARYEFENDELVYKSSPEEIYQFPSFYTDMIDYYGQGGAGQDGLPDQNIEWGGLFVDAGDPNWQKFIREATVEKDYVSGIDWVLGNEGNQLNCDGIFLDTVGVSSTWSAWFPGSFYGDFYWIKDGHIDFMAKIGIWYPDKIIMPNRPMQFVFPGFAGKRYDDFRAVINSLFWESYTPDVDFWWPGNHAKTLENDVRAAQDNSDGRGFTTLALDYWTVMIDAEEGGEFQRAPWYETIGEQVTRAKNKGFMTHVQGSRSMAELTDYVYLWHNQDFTDLPDLYVHSIRGKDNGDGTITATIKITNQGAAVTIPFQAGVWLNNTPYPSELISRLNPFEVYTFQRTLTKQSIGNNLLVAADLANEIDEYDEQPGYVETNNLKSKYLDRFFAPVEGWYPAGFAPDVTVTNVEVLPKYPVVEEELTMRVSYHNNSSEGVATDSRMYVWMGTAEGGSQVGNEYTPYLMPSETKVIDYKYTPSKGGFYSIGIVSDGPKKIIESNENNNEGSGAMLVLKSLDRNPVMDWTSVGVLGPMPDITGDGVAPAADITNSWIFADNDYVYYRMRYNEIVDVVTYRYIIFMDTDLYTSTGYSVGGLGADFAVINGDLYSYTGSGADWKWQGAPYEDSPLFVVENDEHYLDIKINRSVLGLTSDPKQEFKSYFTVSDHNNETTDDATVSYAYPPLTGLLIIDGKFSDWDDEPSVKLLAADPTDDGYDKDGNSVPGQLGAFADIENAWAAKGANYLFMRLDFLGDIDFTKAEYSIYFDMDRDNLTGYKISWDVVGAEYRFWNGHLYKYIGDGVTWEWEEISGGYYALGVADPDEMEIAIRRSAIGWVSDSSIRMFVMVSDKKGEGWEDNINDYMPEQGRGIVYPAVPLADLTVSEVRVTPADPRVGNNAVVTVGVRNDGLGDAGNFEVKIWIGGVGQTGKAVSGLINGGSCEVNFDWVPSGTGLVWIGAKADSNNQIDETNEGNNEDGIPANVQENISGIITIDGNFSDWGTAEGVEVLGIDGTDDGYNKDGQELPGELGSFADIVKGYGVKDADYLFIRLEFGGTINTVNGEYSIYFDTDRDNGTGYKVSWDVVGAEYRFWNGHLYKYIGDGVTWEWEEISGGYYALGVADPDEMEIAIRRSAIGWVSDSSIRMFVMVSDKKGEGWEDNINDYMPEQGRGIVYPAVPLADLTVTSVICSPASPFVNNPVTITVDVDNAGPGDADSFKVGLWIDGVARIPQTVAGLAGGVSTQLTFNWTPTEAKLLFIGAKADSASQIDEGDETNNEKGVNVLVQ